MMRSLQRQTGVGLVTAIFLLVVIAGLAAAMVTVFSSQQAASQLDVQGARAYQAARAGIEWGLFRQRSAGACDVTNSFALPAASMLGMYTVTVVCETVAGPGGDAGTSVRRLTATACNQPSGGACPAPAANLDYVERVIEVQL
ncbi:agglutinin biogenesis protein MshP [Massilia sp. S19_KUP03_FR1]|uniref:agglutinin biogenesis protein MshP n=1 Tax=Massilia sp. S19_KUP03_FR1 TaxID=3025503 RepID=UPI002FCDC2B3